MPEISSAFNTEILRIDYRMSSEIVESYSGQTYPERPRAFHWEGQRLEVSEILSRWRTPNAAHFKIRIDDGRIFELIYEQIDDQWIICSR